MPWVMRVKKVAKSTLGLLKKPLVVPCRFAAADRTVCTMGCKGAGVRKTCPPVKYLVKSVGAPGGEFVWHPLQSPMAETRYAPRAKSAWSAAPTGGLTSLRGLTARPRRTSLGSGSASGGRGGAVAQSPSVNAVGAIAGGTAVFMSAGTVLETAGMTVRYA